MRSLKAQKTLKNQHARRLTGSTRCIGSSGRTAGTSSQSQQPTEATDAHLSVIFFASQHCFLCSLVALRFPDKFVLNYSGNQFANISQPSMVGTMYQATGDLVNAAAFGLQCLHAGVFSFQRANYAERLCKTSEDRNVVDKLGGRQHVWLGCLVRYSSVGLGVGVGSGWLVCLLVRPPLQLRKELQRNINTPNHQRQRCGSTS